MEFKAVIGAELVRQPRARRGDADSLLERGQRILRQPHAVVAHLHHELVVLAAGADVDVPGAGLARDAVLDGVLDQRLQQQRRHEHVVGFRLHVVADDETVGEAGAFDLEVLAEEVELVLQRDLRLAETLERQAQQGR